MVLKTEPCNWRPAPDRCDPVGLSIIGLDGEELAELTPEQPMAMRSMALTPMRDRVAWTWNWELFAMALDGAEPERLTEPLVAENVAEYAFEPTWSPDASEILDRWVTVNLEHTWYRLEVATGRTTEVAMPVDCWAMAWSPDGETVACEVPHRFNVGESNETERADIYLVNLSSLDATPLTEVRDAIDDRRPDWSPDGAWLAIQPRRR